MAKPRAPDAVAETTEAREDGGEGPLMDSVPAEVKNLLQKAMEDHTLEEAGQLTRERICQIEAKALRKTWHHRRIRKSCRHRLIWKALHHRPRRGEG